MLTAVHVIFGTLALAAAPAALLVRKGGTWHRRFGWAFGLTMAVVLLSAGFMWQAKGHVFLVPLGIISGYLVINGYRVTARRRRRPASRFQDGADIAAAVAVIAAGLGAAYLAIWPSSALLRSIAPALLGIGAIGISFGLNDVLGFFGSRMRTGWLLAHFAALIAAYISAVTAFLVINAHHAPMLLRWILPSALGGSVIVAYTLRSVRFAWPVASATPWGHRIRVRLGQLTLFGWKIGSGRTL
jgi:uncharacterized membrane protein